MLDMLQVFVVISADLFSDWRLAMAMGQSDGVLGYEAIFDGEPDRKYMCPICLVIMRDAMQTVCGHRFCKECILKVAR